MTHNAILTEEQKKIRFRKVLQKRKNGAGDKKSNFDQTRKAYFKGEGDEVSTL